jgi:hypothetical protein
MARGGSSGIGGCNGLDPWKTLSAEVAAFIAPGTALQAGACRHQDEEGQSLHGK